MKYSCNGLEHHASEKEEGQNQIIGHSENAPCPNRKKLILPELTAAMMTIFFPCLSAINGWGLRTGPTVANGVGPDEIGAVAAGGWSRRWRGRGGDNSGNSANKSVSSCRVGIGVVRALENVDVLKEHQDAWQNRIYFTQRFGNQVLTEQIFWKAWRVCRCCRIAYIATPSLLPRVSQYVGDGEQSGDRKE